VSIVARASKVTRRGKTGGESIPEERESSSPVDCSAISAALVSGSSRTEVVFASSQWGFPIQSNLTKWI